MRILPLLPILSGAMALVRHPLLYKATRICLGCRAMKMSTEAARLGSICFNPDVPLTDATPVIVMHGLLGNAKNFQGIGTKLAGMVSRPRRIYAVDMRNHGASSHHSSMSYAEMAGDIMSFMGEQGMQKAVLVGHSMGGKAAAMAALLNKDAVQGLVVIDIAPVGYSPVDSTNWGETQRIINSLRSLDMNEVTDRRSADSLLSRDIVDPMLRAFALTNLEQKGDGSFGWRVNIESIYSSMSGLAQFNMDEAALSYEGDALFVAGGSSRYIRPQHLDQVKQLFPRYQLMTIRGAGHWVHADDPQATLDILKMFLDRPELP
ncbi:unnamed protein product [Chrysoparadoxa australica]